MTIRYLVDTDWVIHYLNDHADIVRRLHELQPQGLGLSVISLAELYEGIHYSTEKRCARFSAGNAAGCASKGLSSATLIS